MIRDELAFIRTHLANERTALAYLRTSLASLAAGAGLIHFIPSVSAMVVGAGLVAVGVIALMVGLSRFLYVRKCIYNASTGEE